MIQFTPKVFSRPPPPKFASFKEVELTDQPFTNYQLYSTHDNGGTAFIIQVRNDKQHVHIYEMAFTKQTRAQTSTNMIEQEMIIQNDQDENTQPPRVITRKGLYYKSFNEREAYFYAWIKELDASETPFEVYPGIDNSAEVYPHRSHDPDDSSRCNGAIVLIRFVPSNECWLFGIALSKFTLTEKIQAVYCPIGNSDVVYGYWLTEDKCYILQGGFIYSIERKHLTQNGIHMKDLYDFFFNNVNQFKRQEIAFESEQITSKNHYYDPTVPLLQL